MTSKNEFRNDIQVLRGFALVAVVFFHAFENTFTNGFLGVDVFFLISGFVITPQIFNIFDSHAGRAQRLKSFYIRRFYRLIPALGAMLGFSSILILLLGSPDDHERFARQGISTLLFGGNFGAYLYSQDYFSPNPNPLVHTWSLAVEQQFYIFLPFLLAPFLMRRIRGNLYLFLVFLLFSAFSFISFLNPNLLEPLYSRIGINLASQFSFYSTLDRVWQFALGGFAYFFVSTKRAIKLNTNRFIKICLMIILLMLLFTQIPISQITGSVLISIFALISIIYKCFDLLPNFVIRNIEWIGNRSYSIYLIHMPLLYLVRYSPSPILGTGRNQIFAILGAVALSFFLGGLGYAKVEQRFRKGWMNSAGLKRTVFNVCFAALLIPFSILLLIDIGSRNQYWGIEQSMQPPQGAFNFRSGCSGIGDLSEPCLVAISGARQTVLLIGDSHATHISQTIIDVAADRSWNTAVWTKGSCAIQFKQSYEKSLPDRCIEQNLDILGWAQKQKPSVIIVSQFVKAESSQIDLRDALAKLRLITPNVLLIENTPVFPDKSRFMVRLPLLFPRYYPPKSFPQSKMVVADKFASDELGEWARKNQIVTMDLSSLFCSDDLCKRFSSAGWLYFDDDHLSLEGAKLSANLFDDYFENILQK